MLLLACWLAVTGAQARPVRVDAVEAELVAERDAAVPGSTLMLGLRIRHDPHWHTYWRNPGDSGLPTRLELRLPEGWKAGEIVWPAPRRFLIGPLANYGFEDELLLPVPVSVPAQAGGPVELRARAQWLVCREVCIPGEAELALKLPVAASAGPSAQAPLFERAAIATPRQALPVRVALERGGPSLGFEHAEAGSAEFFPYREGLVSAPAPQRLYRLPGGGWRLELSSAEGADAAAFERAGFRSGPIGVMVLDGQPFEAVAGAGEVAAGGVLVATAEGADRSGGLFPGGGTGSRLLQGLGGSPAAGTGPAGGGGLALAIAVLSGAIGGLILNLMPCVFPVIGLKVLGFAGHGGADAGTRGAGRRGALAFAAGVLLSFWLLAALLLVLRGAGQAVGWGFQLQSPAFVAAMALLFVVIGLNFAGVFEFGMRLTRLGGLDAAVAGRGGAAGSFGSGMLAVLVATPCTAPFMGSALGYTLGRPAPEVFLVFAAIALGMALPYVVLGFFPGLLRWLPRPGRWMESFRQLLAFPMFATVAWLAWVLGLQAGVDAVLALAIGAVLVALAAWLYGRFVQAPGARGRALAGVLALAAMATGIWLAWPDGDGLPVAGGAAGSAATGAGPGAGAAAGAGLGRAGGGQAGSGQAGSGQAGSGQAGGRLGPAAGTGTGASNRAIAGGWEPWSQARVAQARAAGQPVFVDFTAAWCVSCQANKKLVLEREPVVSEMARRGVLRLRADWTLQDPAITAELASHGRNGVPLYLLYVPGEAQPRILPEILAPRIVIEALASLDRG